MIIYAGNVVRITSVFTTLTAVVIDPDADVWITDPHGNLIATLTPTVDTDGVTVTITAEWEIADSQRAGRYIATVDLSGSVIAATQETIPVERRAYVA